MDVIAYSLISPTVPPASVKDELNSLVRKMSNYDQMVMNPTTLDYIPKMDLSTIYALQSEEVDSDYSGCYDRYDYYPISTCTTTDYTDYKTDAQQYEMFPPYLHYGSNLHVSAEQPIVPSSNPTNSKQRARVSCTESLNDLLNGFQISFGGNHDDMTQSWSKEEFKVRRRVVQFFKNGGLNRIKASFKAVDPKERPKNGIFVSCVYWYDKKAQCDKWYFTSTDYLNLLESLTGIRLTSDEKNRIRRNLEEYKPITVGKNKNDSNEIYKDLMAYSFAKPRNAEKNIKIYEWRYLIQAIEKIINKYSGRIRTAVRIEERIEAGTSGSTTVNDNGGTTSVSLRCNIRVANGC